MGTVLSDTVDLLPSEESALLLYARIWLYALASIDRGLRETHPLYAAMPTHQRVSVLCGAGGKAIKPKTEGKSYMPGTQQLSDMAAAYDEIRRYFDCRIVFEEDSS